MMASVSVRADSLLVGLLDGTLLLLNRQGSVVFGARAGRQPNPVILGDAVSIDAALMASVSGIGPQILTVLRRAGSNIRSLRGRCLPPVSARGPDVLLSGRGGSWSSKAIAPRGCLHRVPVAYPGFPFGESLRSSLSGHGRFVALAAREGERAELQILAPFMAPILRESFTARELSLAAIDGQLLLGMDGTAPPH